MSKFSAESKCSGMVLTLNSLLTKAKEINENQTVVLNDMELTVGQINEARSFGNFKGNKWGNEENETNRAPPPWYSFHFPHYPICCF